MVEIIENKNNQQQIRLNLGISWQSKMRTNQNRVKQKKQIIIKYANINWFDAIKRKWTKNQMSFWVWEKCQKWWHFAFFSLVCIS